MADKSSAADAKAAADAKTDAADIAADTKAIAANKAAAATSADELNAEEKAAYDKAQAASRALLNKVGQPMDPPRKPEELVSKDDPPVACLFKRRVTLTLDNHQQVTYPPGINLVPQSLVTGYSYMDAKTREKKTGMHPYLIGAGVQVAQAH